MSLLVAMLPFYILGNIHCLGMCGPLVLMLGHHRYRNFYFLGRTLSFTLVALLAAELGQVIGQVSEGGFPLTALVSFLFASVILVTGIAMLRGHPVPIGRWFSGVERSLSLLLLKDQIWPTFLFGFCTVFLPCGQSLIVFSACALSGDPFTGFINGFAFALLTSPSLYFAMRARGWLTRFKHLERPLMGSLALLIALLAFARTFANLGYIPHLTLNSHYHLTLF